MRGYVEIYRIDEDSKEELILQEGDNLIVNTGKELIVDMLTFRRLPHEDPIAYDLSNFCRLFMGFGQTPLAEVSAGAHVTSSLASSSNNINQTNDAGVSAIQTIPPNPRDTQIHAPEQEFSLMPNHINLFNNDYGGAGIESDPDLTGLANAERWRRGCFYPSGVGDGGRWLAGGFPELLAVNYTGVMNSDGIIYPNGYELSSRVQGTEASATFGVSNISGVYNPFVDRAVRIEVHLADYDAGFVGTHYGNFQQIGLFGLDYYKTRKKVGLPLIDLRTAEVWQFAQKPVYNLRVATNPVFKLFSKKSIGNGQNLGFFADTENTSGAGSTGNPRFGIVIRWNLFF